MLICYLGSISPVLSAIPPADLTAAAAAAGEIKGTDDDDGWVESKPGLWSYTPPPENSGYVFTAGVPTHPGKSLKVLEFFIPKFKALKEL